MGKYLAPMTENLRKSVGNVVYYMKGGETYVRSKAAQYKDAGTEKQLKQRAAFRLLIQMSQALVDATRVGFPQRPGTQTHSNAFVQANKAAVTVEENLEASMKLNDLLVAKGNLFPPAVTVTYTSDGKTFTLSQGQGEVIGGNPDDQVFAVFLETVANQSVVVPLKTREEGGIGSFALPEWWDADQCHVYAFALSADRKRASNSVYLNITRE